jgi:TonB family protein
MGPRQRAFTVLVLLFIALQTSAAEDPQHLLDQKFGGHVFFIRGFYSDDDLTYDSEGNVIGKPRSGPWSLAMFKIEKIDLRANGFLLEGRRGASVYDEKAKQFKSFLAHKEPLKITILTDPATLSEPGLARLAQQVFAPTIRAPDVPEFWRDFFSGKENVRTAPKPGEIWPGRQSAGNPVYQVGGAVTAPRVKSKEDPQYSKLAREARLQGTTSLSAVINAQGVPEDVQVSKPLGMGLDEQAVQAAQKWRFEPAQLHGKPVAVPIIIEITFHF